MKVIILSSGISSRLGYLTENIHKCLLKIGNKTLIEHQLDAMITVKDINEIIIIIGYKGELVRRKVGDKYKGVSIKYIYNSEYKQKEINYTLYLAKNEIYGQPFIYLEGDLIFHPDLPKKLIQSSKKSCVVVDKNYQSKAVDTIVTGKNNICKSLYFKEHRDFSGQNGIKNLVGELILMIKFDKNLGMRLIQELEKNGFSKNMKSLYYIFNELFKRYNMQYIEINDIPWVEIDNPEDLKKAENIWSCI